MFGGIGVGSDFFNWWWRVMIKIQWWCWGGGFQRLSLVLTKKRWRWVGLRLHRCVDGGIFRFCPLPFTLSLPKRLWKSHVEEEGTHTSIKRTTSARHVSLYVSFIRLDLRLSVIFLRWAKVFFCFFSSKHFKSFILHVLLIFLILIYFFCKKTLMQSM